MHRELDRAGERGFALPLTILLVALLSLLLTAAFTRAQADRRVADSSGASISAFTVAQSGLQRYLGDTATGAPNPSTICPAGRPRLPPVDGDSVRVNTAGGYADVVARIVERPADSLMSRLYMVRSTGRVVDPAQGADPQASSTVAQFAFWQTGAMQIQAALTAARGVTRGAGTLTISGTDATGTAPNVYGVRVPAGNPALGATVSGTPAPVLALDTAYAVAQQTRIKWSSVINGGITPDFNYVALFNYQYPVQLVQGNVTLPSGLNFGTGLLIVTGDLTLKGLVFGWHGIILVGGTLRDSTSGVAGIQGAVVTGLNAQLGAAPAASRIAVGPTFGVTYNSCTVRTSLLPLSGFVPVKTAWVHNWATY